MSVSRQPDLFDVRGPSAPYPSGPGFTNRSTSKAAAAAIEPRIGAMQRRVLDFIASRGKGGATLHEIAAGTGMALHSVCGRRKELEAKGLVGDSGARRDGPSGQANIVWVAR